MEYKLSKRNIGEKGHLEYTWNEDDLMNQINFQIVRGEDHTFLEKKWFVLLEKIYNGKMVFDIKYLIINTRDIRGKGEQKISFKLLFILWNFDKILVKIIFKSFVETYGSMKDIKYFCDFVYKKTMDKNHEIIMYIMELSYEICKLDEADYNKNIQTNNVNLTLFGKWFPRSKSDKFGWINKMFSKKYYKNKPFNVGQKKLRKLLVKFNMHLNTVEIKMSKCQEIDFKNVPINALLKYRKTFLEDSKFKDFIDKDMTKNSKNFKNIYYYKLISSIVNTNNSLEYKFLLNIWNKKKADILQTKSLEYLTNLNSIIICDTSQTFYNNDDILNNAIGLSIMLSEINNYKNRVLSFNTSAKWLRFDGLTLREKILLLKEHSKIGYSNIYNAIELVLQGITKPSDIKDLTLIILTDFQIDVINGTLFTLYENIVLLFNELGRFKNRVVPNLIFWNLKSTNGFPGTIYDKCILKSGYNFT